MRIAIIGAGNVGSALASAFVKAGHSVVMSASKPEHAEAAARAVGAAGAESNAAAVGGASAVVLAVPVGALPVVAAEIGDSVIGLPVIDATNVLNSDMTGIASERSGAQDLQDLLPGASVVKAFNTVLSPVQSAGVLDGRPIDGFYAGDDEDSKAVVRDLLGDLGYKPIDAGPLAMARALEEMALLNIRLNAVNGWPWQSGWKLAGPTG